MKIFLFLITFISVSGYAQENNESKNDMSDHLDVRFCKNTVILECACCLLIANGVKKQSCS